MPNIMIAGYYGCHNAGDEAMLAAIIADLRRRLPGAQYCVVTSDPAFTAARHGVRTIHRLDASGILTELRRSDLFISGGGSLIQDVTSDRNLAYQLGLLAAAKLLCRSVMVYGQGIGPLRSRLGRYLACRMLNSVHAITVRDRESFEFLRAGGVSKPPLYLAADPAFLLDHRPDPYRGRAIIQQASRTDPTVEATLAKAADLVHDSLGAAVVLIPMQLAGDLECCRRIAGMMRRPAAVIDRLLDPGDALDVCSAVSMIVGMRLHSLIFAVMAGTVPTGITYDPKVSAFLREVGLEPAGTVPGLTLADLMLHIERTWRRRTELEQSLAQMCERLRERALISGRVAAALARGDAV